MGRQPLYPHVPKRREPLYPHVPRQRLTNHRFIEVGERVRYIADYKYRYEHWPEGALLMWGVEGVVTEYHPEQPPLPGESKGSGAWAVVRWDFGGETAIKAEDEGKRWEKVVPPHTEPGQPEAGLQRGRK